MQSPRARIFLLSHMRAYTSLVGHILGSHPQIDGYYEMHRSYRTPDDLERQTAQYAASDALKPGSRYLFDKLLHNDYTLDLDALDPVALGAPASVVLVSLRPPAPTLASIVRLFAAKSPDDPYATPAGATNYYIERLRALAAFGMRFPGRYRYFDAARVLDETARVLAALGDWLALDTPLSPAYRHFSQTGVAGAGDSSPAIAAGRVLDTGQKTDPAIELDAALLAEAERAYAECRATLIAHAAAALT